MSNTKLWDAVYRTDPSQTKSFKRTGGFSGTAIKPLYLIHKATELWGPMGDVWGAESGEPVIAGNFIFIKARLWHPGTTGKAWVEHWGGDVLMKGDKPNDEAAKMAFTDAIGKCLVQLGFSADVHMGEFDGNKYVAVESKTKPETAVSRNKRYISVKEALEGSHDPAETWHEYKAEIDEFKITLGGDYYQQLVDAGAKRKQELMMRQQLEGVR
jgi:hypothetical protein